MGGTGDMAVRMRGRAEGMISRRTLLIALGLAGVAGELSYQPARAVSVATHDADAIQVILNLALTAEHLSIAFYYTALTAPAVMHDHRLGGPSADPNNPGLPPGGHPSNVKDLQAALDAEVQHAAAFKAAGGVSPYTHFYFPAGTFAGLGSPTQQNSVLGRLNTLETACVSAYAAAARQFLLLGRPDLATVAARIMGVEAEHRVLGRVIAGIDPLVSLATEIAPIMTVDEAAKALHPFLTGREGIGFTGPAGPPVPLPSKAQTTRVIGRYHTRVARGFLSGGGHV